MSTPVNGDRASSSLLSAQYQPLVPSVRSKLDIRSRTLIDVASVRVYLDLECLNHAQRQGPVSGNKRS